MIKILERDFQECDWNLLYHSRFKDFKGKLMTRWLGPYKVDKCYDNGAVQIRTIDEEGIPLLVNGYSLKGYKNPLSRARFINSINREVYFIGDSIVSNASPS